MPSPIHPIQPSTDQLAAVIHLLPSAVQQMANRISLDYALRVAKNLGGTSRLIPIGNSAKSAVAVQKLISDLGCQETAEALIENYGGQIIYLPSCSAAERALRNLAIHHAAEEGLGEGRSMISIVRNLAGQYHLSDRRIWEILSVPAPERAALHPPHRKPGGSGRCALPRLGIRKPTMLINKANLEKLFSQLNIGEVSAMRALPWHSWLSGCDNPVVGRIAHDQRVRCVRVHAHLIAG